MSLALHRDPAWFREAVRHTAAATGFLPRLVEKDYFCSVLLEALAGVPVDLVFKGGTCLSKVHTGFFRLSEDLDFSISMPENSNRTARRHAVDTLRTALTERLAQMPELTVAEPWEGANNSTQYGAKFAYTSMLSGLEEQLKVEVGLRETVCEPSIMGLARSLVLNPLTNQPAVPGVHVRCLTQAEAMAEKIRAALCRREPAIRDFFDVEFALRSGTLKVDEPSFRNLVGRKVRAPGTEPPDLSPARIEQLRRQVETQLRPVLRATDLKAFDLDGVLAAVRGLALSLGILQA